MKENVPFKEETKRLLKNHPGKHSDLTFMCLKFAQFVQEDEFLLQTEKQFVF